MTALAPAEFGGYPMVDDTFDPQRLLAAVAAVRWHEASNAPAPIHLDHPSQALVPDRAVRIRRLRIPVDVTWQDLTSSYREQVRLARELVISAVPSWGPFLNIPVRYGSMPGTWPEAISASSYAYPQHIALGENAFGSLPQLAEQLTHEISHQWLYFIEEMRPFHDSTRTSGRAEDVSLTLPSGTSNRNLSEVIGALHVAHNLLILWQAMDVPEADRVRRLADLDIYAAGCHQMLREVMHLLSDEGQAIAERLMNTTTKEAEGA